jgi:hypothetical protein
MGLCLNSNFNSFERAESQIGKNFSRGTAHKENKTPVAINQHVGVKGLEIFI